MNPNGAGEIGYDFMSECVNLDSIGFETRFGNTKKIGAGFMYNCHKLETIDISKFGCSANDSIGAGMFFGCEKLTSLTIGDLAATCFQQDVIELEEPTNTSLSFAMSKDQYDSIIKQGGTDSGITVTGTNKAALKTRFPDRPTDPTNPQAYRTLNVD